MALYAEMTRAWMTESKAEFDILQLYHLVASFIGNEAVQYILNHRRSIPDAEKWLKMFSSDPSNISLAGIFTVFFIILA